MGSRDNGIKGQVKYRFLVAAAVCAHFGRAAEKVPSAAVTIGERIGNRFVQFVPAAQIPGVSIHDNRPVPVYRLP